jgi:acyl dehydratase
MLYYEDIKVGHIQRFGDKLVTREEVIEFASKFDPQPFHLSDEAAAKTHFGRISASGWHTGAMVMAMAVANMQSGEGSAGLGSPGIDELRWLKPVYPGDRLNCETEVIFKRRSASKPEMGIVKNRMTVRNQNGEVVMTHIANGLMATRDPSGTD